MYEIPVDEVRECIAFFAEKLFFDDNEKRLILSDTHQHVYNPFITLSEQCQDLERQIEKQLMEVEKKVIKRENYDKFYRQPSKYLRDFLHMQNQNIKMLKSDSQTMLKKRNWHDQNDFLGALLSNY